MLLLYHSGQPAESLYQVLEKSLDNVHVVGKDFVKVISRDKKQARLFQSLGSCEPSPVIEESPHAERGIGAHAVDFLLSPVHSHCSCNDDVESIRSIILLVQDARGLDRDLLGDRGEKGKLFGSNIGKKIDILQQQNFLNNGQHRSLPTKLRFWASLRLRGQHIKTKAQRPRSLAGRARSPLTAFDAFQRPPRCLANQRIGVRRKL